MNVSPSVVRLAIRRALEEKVKINDFIPLADLQSHWLRTGLRAEDLIFGLTTLQINHWINLEKLDGEFGVKICRSIPLSWEFSPNDHAVLRMVRERERKGLHPMERRCRAVRR